VRTPTLEEAALRVVKRLRKAGHKAYWVGGCVRDMLLERQPHEIDIATSATPQQITQLFRKTIPVGAQFGVIIVVVGPHQFQVATFRKESGYANGRHPDKVSFCDEKTDVMRRDFTINGLLYDPIQKKVYDFVGGREDIRRGIIRAIGDPKERFREDRLRMLRAVRFAVQLNFRIEDATFAALKEEAAQIVVVSGERIREELGRMLSVGRNSLAAKLLVESGLFAALFPEVKDVEHASAVLGNLPSCTVVTALAAVYHKEGEAAAAECAQRLKMSREERARLLYLTKHHNALDGAAKKRLSFLKRLFARPEWDELLALYEAKAKAGCGERESAAFVRRLRASLKDEEINPPPLLDGNDLIEAGFSPSPAFGRVLEAVYDAQLEGRVSSKEEALELARRLFREQQCM